MQEQLNVKADRLFQKGIQQYQNSQFQAALQSLYHALAIYQKVSCQIMEGRTLGNLGICHYLFGDYLRAIEYQQQHLVIAEKILDPLGEEKSPLGNLGIIYAALGNYPKSLEYYTKVLEITQKIQDNQGEAKTLGNIGNVYYALGEYTKAIEYHQGDLDFMQKLKNFEGQREALANLGLAYEARGEYITAIKLYQKSLSIARNRKTKNRRGEGIVLGLLGIVFKTIKSYTKAIKYHYQSLTIAKEIKDYVGEGVALNNIGSTLLEIGNYTIAEKRLHNGIKIWESIRAKLGSYDDYKVSIFEQQTRTYRLLQKVLIEQNKTDEALEISERGRARAFVDLLNSRLSIAHCTYPSTATSPSINQIKQTASVHSSTLVQYSIIYDTDATKGKEVQAIESELFTWVIKPTGEIVFRQVDLKPLKQQNSSLSKLVTQSRESIGVEEKVRGATPTTTQETLQPIRYINEPLRQLHQYLIEPIANLLPSDPNTPVIFIPQGALFLVPFSALQDATGKFLIEQHTILTAPFIQVLDLTHQQRQRVATSHELPLQSQDVLVVGNPTMPTIPLREPLEPLPTLPGSEAEANAIASLLNTQAIIGDQATKVDIVQQMPKARLIHLATHGLLDDIKQLGVPGAIALAPFDNDNGFLTAGEIMEMFGQPQNSPLQAELIVLSACVTGLGKITGDGVIGLSRCLMAAGVSRLIVSLWPVSDLATAFLMIQFHKILKNLPQLKPGDAARTLNHAQKWLLNLTSEEAEQELEKLKPHIYQAYAGRSKRVAEVRINRYLKNIRERAPYPFANPVYWSAFTTIGL